ncbi:LiaF transmembrane domain-containing protein [Halobacterium yunchengense]|uniref:LiaF transmembrane domain-containing protein n=1 Tax=Halobacterium yunchengense TaxID=3108497 RepID=UPI00300A1111
MLRVRSSRLTTGLLIVLVGVLLLLSTTDAAPTESLWDFLPSVFVALGLWALVRSRFRNLTGPAMVVAVATTYQAKNLGYVTDQQLGTWWPLFVVLFGVLYTVGKSRRRRAGGGSTAEVRGGDVSLVSLFSGSQRRVTGAGFRGGDVLVAFGGAELDLRDADRPSEPATVDCLVLFGGAELRVPEDWNVELDVLSLFGGAEDERPRGVAAADGDVDLVVTGLALFGGVGVDR